MQWPNKDKKIKKKSFYDTEAEIPTGQAMDLPKEKRQNEKSF